MIENPCKKCDDPAMGCANTCGDLAEYRYIEKLEKELKQAKKLLKAAVEDIKYLINHAERNGKACDRCKYGNEMYCYADDCSNDAKWQHEAEALALIGDGST